LPKSRGPQKKYGRNKATKSGGGHERGWREGERKLESPGREGKGGKKEGLF